MGQIKINDLIVLDIDIIKWLHFFDLTHFRSLGQKSKNNFIPFLAQMRTRKFAFDIKWPLGKDSWQTMCWKVSYVSGMFFSWKKKY